MAVLCLKTYDSEAQRKPKRRPPRRRPPQRRPQKKPPVREKDSSIAGQAQLGHVGVESSAVYQVESSREIGRQRGFAGLDDGGRHQQESRGGGGLHDERREMSRSQESVISSRERQKCRNAERRVELVTGDGPSGMGMPGRNSQAQRNATQSLPPRIPPSRGMNGEGGHNLTGLRSGKTQMSVPSPESADVWRREGWITRNNTGPKQ